MYIGRIMRTDLVTVPPEMPLAEARELIDQKGIEHLLVVSKEGKLMGVVSDRDIRQNWASSATTLSSHELNYLLSKVTMAMIMRKKIVTITPDTTIERAALIIQEKRIGSLPVMENDRLVGIITRTDVLKVLLDAIGIAEGSVRFQVLIRDRLGALAEIARILSTEGINIQSLISWPIDEHPGVFQLVMRVAARDLDPAVKSLEAGGFAVLTRHVKDLTPYLPKS